MTSLEFKSVKGVSKFYAFNTSSEKISNPIVVVGGLFIY